MIKEMEEESLLGVSISIAKDTMPITLVNDLSPPIDKGDGNSYIEIIKESN
jgi:hypothetical protein